MNSEVRELVQQKLVSRTRVKNGCWVWQGGRYSGEYPTLMIAGRTYSLRRLVYEAYENEPRLGNKDVRSTCGNPYCVNPEHLVRGTRNKSGRPSKNGRK